MSALSEAYLLIGSWPAWCIDGEQGDLVRSELSITTAVLLHRIPASVVRHRDGIRPEVQFTSPVTLTVDVPSEMLLKSTMMLTVSGLALVSR